MSKKEPKTNGVQRSSRLRGFYRLNRGERMDLLRSFADLPVDQTRLLGQDGALPFDLADLFVENAVGAFPLPLGMATSFKINGNDYVIPMAVEESSVIAAASNAARLVYESGGFKAECESSYMIGQIQILDLNDEDWKALPARIEEAKADLLKLANDTHPRLLMRGGGAREIELRQFGESTPRFAVLHVILDTRDAMGANLVNTVCETLASRVEEITRGRVGLKILSNLADRRVFRARCRVKAELLNIQEPKREIPGALVVDRIVEAFAFADHDSYRAATHNKGIMNGVDPVVIATGNDWRAIEAGAHAFASTQTGRYRSLSHWKKDSNGDLCGELRIPLQLGTVGGVTRLHPMAKLSLGVLGNPDAAELGKIIACAGLASNLAALRALCTTGIQRGHMKLHAKNLALAAGARGEEVDLVASELVLSNQVSASAAEKYLLTLRNKKSSNCDESLLTPQSEGTSVKL